MKNHYVLWFPLAFILAMSCSQSPAGPIACARDGTSPSGLACKAAQLIPIEDANSAY